jgi:hypothetical protein
MRLRTLLIAALVAALAIPAATAARTSKGHDHGAGKRGAAAGVVGTWDVTVTPDGGPTFPALLTFHRGGGLTETESDAPGTGLGAWRRTGGKTFAIAFKTFAFTPAGAPQGWVVVRSVVTLDNGKLSGPFKFDVFDPAGNKVQSGSGTASATPFVIPDL